MLCVISLPWWVPWHEGIDNYEIYSLLFLKYLAGAKTFATGGSTGESHYLSVFLNSITQDKGYMSKKNSAQYIMSTQKSAMGKLCMLQMARRATRVKKHAKQKYS